jgi:transposase InsO family protein
MLKTELINEMNFNTLEELSLELFDYVNWYNNMRTHSTLGYLSPVTYRNEALKNIVYFSVDNPVLKKEVLELLTVKDI